MPLFIAPLLLDAAFDFPLAMARTLWRPVTVMAVGAVVLTTAAVAWVVWWAAGLPAAAAVVLGAIVAPSDAAAVAVTSRLSLPRRTAAVLKGESLFNDTSALLLFNGALVIQTAGGFDGTTGARLALAVPGGILLGITLGVVSRWLDKFAGNTLSANLLRFLDAFAVWIVADRLHLSAVLAVVACGMTLARWSEGGGAPRMRIHSFAVWASVVFLLNVLAFLLMGMQVRTILAAMPRRAWPKQPGSPASSSPPSSSRALP